MTKNKTRMQSALALCQFVLKYPRWHEYSPACLETKKAVRVLARIGVIEVINNRFRLLDEYKAREISPNP